MVTRKRASTTVNDSAVLQSAQDLVTTRKTIKELGDREKEVKGRLIDYIKKIGEPDDKGHLWYKLTAKVGDGLGRVKYECRTSRSLDTTKAEGFLKRKKLLDQCSTTVTVIDEEKILAAHYTGDISEDELDSLYVRSESWALKVVE